MLQVFLLYALLGEQVLVFSSKCMRVHEAVFQSNILPVSRSSVRRLSLLTLRATFRVIKYHRTTSLQQCIYADLLAMLTSEDEWCEGLIVLSIIV